MRTIYWRSLSLLLLCCLGASSSYAATSITYYIAAKTSDYSNSTVHSVSPNAACIALSSQYTALSGAFSQGGVLAGGCRGTQFGTAINFGNWKQVTETCEHGNTGLSCNDPPLDPCSSLVGTPTGWKKTWSSFDAYNSDSGKPKCTTSQNGCAVDICGDVGSSSCGQSGETGEYACFGNGSYTGTSQDPSEGGDVDGCEGAACQPPPPVTSSSQQSCTPNVNGSFTCVKNDVSTQFSGSECTVGSVGGSTGYVCVKPDYVPQSHDKTTQDVVTETTNPDGSKTTVKETTTNHTTCKAGVCTTTTTTTTTTNGTNPDGSPGDSSTVCTGDKCDNPATDKDESKEEEGEEEVERTASGTDCSASLSCEGDAIDCAVLEQQKLMRCSMDWETQKGAVLAEAGKAEYQLETDEIDAGSLFNGASAARWLSPSCPADRTVHLTLTNSSIVFSWQFICDYASGLGNLLVALASLFFAIYVGRAWGG